MMLAIAESGLCMNVCAKNENEMFDAALLSFTVHTWKVCRIFMWQSLDQLELDLVDAEQEIWLQTFEGIGLEAQYV